MTIALTKIRMFASIKWAQQNPVRDDIRLPK